MQGLVCTVPNGEVQNACFAEGLLIVAAGDNVVRLVPPLIVRDAEVDEALARLDAAARRCKPATARDAAQ